MPKQPVHPRKEKNTLVVCNTFPNRGKSLTPESRIEILDDKSAFVDRNDDTQEANGFAIMRSLVPKVDTRPVSPAQSMDNVMYVYKPSLRNAKTSASHLAKPARLA